jgi:hypothetical protein
MKLPKRNGSETFGSRFIADSVEAEAEISIDGWRMDEENQ